MATTRQSHLKWCKKRAHEYLARGDIHKAVTSMMSDLEKHPETAIQNPSITMFGIMAMQRGSMTDAKRFIDGFN
jgi:hypothetical protein